MENKTFTANQHPLAKQRLSIDLKCIYNGTSVALQVSFDFLEAYGFSVECIPSAFGRKVMSHTLIQPKRWVSSGALSVYLILSLLIP